MQNGGGDKGQQGGTVTIGHQIQQENDNVADGDITHQVGDPEAGMPVAEFAEQSVEQGKTSFEKQGYKSGYGAKCVFA